MPAAKRFRIAFSFAGEMRDFVEKTAAILARKFGQDVILYDKYHEAEFAVYNLGIKLPKLYREECDLVVAVFSRDYDQKRWTGWEWMAIHAQLTKQDGARIMLTRFQLVNPDGLFENAGFVELDHKTPQQAATLILERLAQNEGRPRDYHTKSDTVEPARIPNNLPTLPHFFGREADLKKILDALTPAARTWGALIDGPGGMGKTSLAIRAAELVPRKDFDRILFLTAKNREMTVDGQKRLHDFVVPGYLEMLSEMGRVLGLPGIAENAEGERAALIQEALAGTRALLILDNLESLTPENRDRLYAFLTKLPNTCKAIVTSRRRTDIDARIVRLEKLDHAAAMAFLTELAADRPLLQRATAGERTALYNETGGNPLIIRWLAGQLGRGQCRTVTAALAFLRSAPPNNDPLEFIFGDLLETFTREETKTLSALTFYTRQVAVKHIAEIAGLTATACRTALEDLTGRSLVIADATEESYVLTPLVADFLRRARPETVQETGNRLEQRAHALIMENGGEKYDRFSVLNTAWPWVEPAIPLFIAGENARLQEICDALYRFLEFTGMWDERLSLSLQAEAKALVAADYEAAMWRVYETGYVHRMREEAGELLKCAERAETYWRASGTGDDTRAMILKLCGLGHQLNKEYDAAIAAFQEMLNLRRRQKAESRDVSTALNDLAIAKRLSGDLDGAECFHLEALRVAQVVGYKEGEASFTGHLAEVALARKHWQSAEILARNALNLSGEVGRQGSIAMDCCRLAMALVRLGKANAAEALPHARRAVEIYTRVGSPSLAEAQATLEECEAALREIGGGDPQPPS